MKNNSSLKEVLVYLIISGFGLFLVIAFRPNFSNIYDLQLHLSRTKQKLLLEQKKNDFLKREFNGLSNDPEYIEKVAREKLGWCRPTETVYRFQTCPSNNRPSDSNKK